MRSLRVTLQALLARRAYRRGNASQLEVMIFSRDRAPQLELLLRSYRRWAQPHPAPVRIQYSASDVRHERAYQQVFALHADVIGEACREPARGFKATLLDLLARSVGRNVLFLVDDIVFIAPFDPQQLARWDAGRSILSLRLGRNITRSFNARCDPQPQPEMTACIVDGEAGWRWDWRAGTLDWALPTALDGHLLPLAEIIPVIRAASIQGPNSLEHELGRYKFLWKTRAGFCFNASRLVNLPLNTVKQEAGFDFPNQMIDADSLADRFLAGARLSFDVHDGAVPDSCHMEWVPELVPVSRIHELDGVSA